ncbi:MAG: ABC transporter ATP-binding protein [Rhodobiaceae bacterium]|nr:ABC transporter ATP-binding protein [Rhodobiaceae bacterium]
MARVSLKNVEKFYGSFKALVDVSLDIEDGEFAVFVGPSGCGKSTLLRSIAGLERISDGSIVIGETDVTHAAPSDRDVAMVFQSYALYPHMTARENIDFGMKVNGVSPDERTRRVAEAARILQLQDYLDRKPGQLSGGQRQRVAIGRAIVKQPKAFLFDEPLSNLDAKLRVQMRVELEALHKQLQVTMIYVTHDQIEAMTMADKIVVLNEGRVEQVGAPLDLYHRPRTEFVAGFIGAPSMNFLDVAQTGGGVAYKGHTVASGISGKAATRIGVRPEHIGIVAPGAGQVDGTVAVREALGGETFLYVDTPDGDRMVAKTDGDDATRPGETVGLAFPAARVHYFDAAGMALTA